MTKEGAALLLGQLVEDLEGELACVFEGSGSDLIQSVTFLVPVAGVAEVSDEVENREICAVHQRDLIVENGSVVGANPVL